MSPPTMTTIAELKEDKKQMEEYIAELEEDKKQMKEHYETAVMTDEELIAEFKKRFVVPQFYTREQIVERIGREQSDGFVPTDDKVDEVIGNFLEEAYIGVDEILDAHIENVDFDEEEDEDEYHVKTEAVGVLDESDDEDDEEVRCVCEDCFLEGRIMVSKKRAEYLKKNVITEYSCVVCGAYSASALSEEEEEDDESEEEDEDYDICGQTGGKCGDFAGCGKKVLCEDTNMFGNTSFCIPCYEKYEEDFKKLEEEEE